MLAVDDVVGVRQAGHRDSKFLFFLPAGASNKKLVSLPSSLGTAYRRNVIISEDPQLLAVHLLSIIVSTPQPQQETTI